LVLARPLVVYLSRCMPRSLGAICSSSASGGKLRIIASIWSWLAKGAGPQYCQIGVCGSPSIFIQAS
jgi:hypothetical protein